METASRPAPAPTRSDTDALHWLALVLTPGIGARKSADLIEAYRSPTALFRASASELRGCGIQAAVAQAIASGCAFDTAIRLQERMKNEAIVLLTIQDAQYPELLRHIFDPPICLFYRGDIACLSMTSIAVVGTRRPTQYGLTVAGRFGREFAQAGACVVSGMARGVDTAAHKGALEAGGHTIAVFGCGVDVIYPTENKQLSSLIAEHGLLLSEFPPGSPAYPQNFPIRNRIVAGLCSGVVVVEGKEFSGSAITARLALDQGREVFAVPGNITSAMSLGPNTLIKQGAQPALSAEDVLVNLPLTARQGLVAQRDLTMAQPLSPMAGLAAQLIEIIPVDAAKHLDEILDLLPDNSSSEIIAALFDLELQGLIRQLAGRTFAKVWT
jgi:DNA processing protein